MNKEHETDQKSDPEQPEVDRKTWNRVHIGVLIWLVVMIILMGIFTEVFR